MCGMKDFKVIYMQDIYVEKFGGVGEILCMLFKKILVYQIGEVWMVNLLAEVMETVRVV